MTKSARFKTDSIDEIEAFEISILPEFIVAFNFKINSSVVHSSALGNTFSSTYFFKAYVKSE